MSAIHDPGAHQSGETRRDEVPHHLLLSSRARRVLDTAQESSMTAGAPEPHSGHLLAALLVEGGLLVEDVFHSLGIRNEDVMHMLSATDQELQPGKEMRDVLASAEASATEASATHAGQIYVSVDHLLLGIAEAGDVIAARALRSINIDLTELQQIVRRDRDMLVPLLAIPNATPSAELARAAGVQIRRARAWEGPALRAFIESEPFPSTWGPESANGFARQPASLFLAMRGERIVGFAAYDCGPRGVFGPTGMARNERARGIATALLLRTLADMRAIGYAYAIIGAVGPAEFYERTCGAVLLPSAWPSYVTASD